MKVLLVSASTEDLDLPTLPLGLASVAAATRRAGHEVRFLDVALEKDHQAALEEAIEEFSPAIIGMSVRNIDDQNMENPRFLLEPVKRVVAWCRALTDVPIVLGGAGYSIYPGSALAYLHADMGIQGEGEMAFPLLVETMQRGGDLSGVPGLWLPGRGQQAERRFIRDLDRLPFPEDHLPDSQQLRAEEELWLPTQTRRGCPLSCSYCSTPAIEGKIMRKRSPSLVVREIARLAERGFHRFHFVDNTFNLPPSYAMELCQGLLEAGEDISWRCILYPWGVNEELIRAMARAGCKEAALGFESGCRRILQGMNKRFNPELVRQISKILQDHGIYRIGFLLLGGPGETRESVEQSLEFADSLNLEMLRLTAGIRIYPNTALAGIALAEGQISPDDDLLKPRFYLARCLRGWLPEVKRRWLAARPNWVG